MSPTRRLTAAGLVLITLIALIPSAPLRPFHTTPQLAGYLPAADSVGAGHADDADAAGDAGDAGGALAPGLELQARPRAGQVGKAGPAPALPQRQRVLGYERAAFGSGWGPAAASPALAPAAACTAREAAILAQVTDTEARLEGCALRQGTVFDPYGAGEVHVEPGTRAVEVDHVLPLAAAWDLGAYAWDARTRQRFANDPLNLVVTAREHNQDKSDDLPSRWMPPAPAHRCWYAGRVRQVADAYGLALPAADLRAMARACRMAGLLPQWLE